MTVKQAARKATVSAAVVYAWCAGGGLAHYRLGKPGHRGTIKIAEADLDAFLEQTKVQNRPEPVTAPAPRMTFKHLRFG